jgi:dipeptidyl aminopeptidase/acylaminoacyl peptidase
MKKRRIRNMAIFAVLVFIILVMTAGALMARSGAMILIHPARTEITARPDSVGLTNYEDVRLTTVDGVEIAAWYIAPPVESRAALIFVHGLGHNRQYMLDQAAVLYRNGYGALLIDLRNHGESGGEMTTLGFYEPYDIQAGIDFLLTRPEVDSEQIGVVGQSLGGVTAIRAAAQMPELRAVVVQSVFTSIEENIASGVRQITGLPAFPFAPMVIYFGQQETGLSIEQVRPIDDIAHISPRAVLLLHGQQDRTITPDNSQRLYDAAGEPKQLVWFPDAAHGGLMASDSELWETSIVSFLDRYLRGIA